MNIEQILKEVARYAKKVAADLQEIQAKTVEYDKKVAQGLMGRKEANAQIEGMRAELQAFRRNRASELNQVLLTAYDAEQGMLNSMYNKVTADDVAELALLSEMAVNGQTLERYKQMYKGKPLALKKLQKIAQEQEIFDYQAPPDPYEALDNLVRGAQSNIQTFKNTTTEPFVIGAVAAGIDDSMAQTFNSYVSAERGE